MSEVNSVPNKFTTIQFTTKDGEKCTATKKDGIVTVVGDKNGVRQIPLNDFMKEFVENMPKVDLVKTPNKDTVQFSGAEKPVVDTTKTDTPSEEKKSGINKKNFAIGSALALIAGTGIYVFGRGKWWAKAAQNLERKGQEVADDIANGIKNGLKEGEKKSETLVEDVVQEAEVLTGKNPEIKIEPLETKLPKTPEATVEVPKTEPPKTPEVKVEPPKAEVPKAADDIVISREQNLLAVKSPIPESELFVIPKDLETNVEKIIKNGTCEHTHFPIYGKHSFIYTVKTPEGFTRQYVISKEKELLSMNEFHGLNVIPFRTYEFQHGQVRAITDRTKPTLHKKFFQVEAPKTEAAPAKTNKTPAAKKRSKEELKKAEIAKQEQKEVTKQLEENSQRQQEEFFTRQQQEIARQEQETINRINEDAIHAGVIADMAMKNVEKVAKESKVNTDRIAKETQKLAEEIFEHHPEKSAEELIAHNPTRQVDRFGEDLEFGQKIEYETPKFGNETDNLLHTDEFNPIRTDYEPYTPEMPDIHIDDGFGSFGDGLFG